MSAGAGSVEQTSAGAIAAAGPLLGLPVETLSRLLWAPAGLLASVRRENPGLPPPPIVLDGEWASRAAALGRIERLLVAALGDRRAVDHWLRRPNPALAGERPLDWLAGPGRHLAQLELRLARERDDRRWRPAHG